MKNTVGKGIIFYIFILMAVITGVVCLFGAILVLSPGTEIFGVNYFSQNTKDIVDKYKVKINDISYGTEEYSIDTGISNGSIKTIKLTTNYYGVEVVNSDRATFAFEVAGQSSGFSNTSSTGLISFVSEFFPDTNTLSFSITEPDAFFFLKKAGTVKLLIPNGKTLATQTVVVETQSGRVELGARYEDNVKVKNLDLTINDGQLYFGEGFTLTNGIIKINAKSGSINAHSNITTSDMQIKTNNSKINLKNISGNLTIESKMSVINIDHVGGNLYYDAEKGVLFVGKIVGNFECDEGVVISNITINEAVGELILPNADSSNITVKKAHRPVFINTKTGSVNIGELLDSATISTTSGNIDIVIKNQNTCAVNLTTTSGRINAYYLTVVGQSKLKTTKGEINLNYVTGNVFDLTYNCTKHAPVVTQGISTTTVAKSGTFHIGHAEDMVVNILINVENSEGKTSFKDNLSPSFAFKY